MLGSDAAPALASAALRVSTLGVSGGVSGEPQGARGGKAPPSARGLFVAPCGEWTLCGLGDAGDGHGERVSLRGLGDELTSLAEARRGER